MTVALRLLILGLAWGGPGCARRASIETGRQLFVGDRPLAAHLSGDDTPLPIEASRCVNCHVFGPALDAASARTQTFGPSLTGAFLRGYLRRRGGPPSTYDVEAFCRLMGTGVDPAHILVQRTMPRYDFSAADCRSLWDYLVARP